MGNGGGCSLSTARDFIITMGNKANRANYITHSGVTGTLLTLTIG